MTHGENAPERYAPEKPLRFGLEFSRFRVRLLFSGGGGSLVRGFFSSEQPVGLILLHASGYTPIVAGENK